MVLSKKRKELEYQRTLEAVTGDESSNTDYFMRTISQGFRGARRLLKPAVIMLAFSGQGKAMQINEPKDDAVAEEDPLGIPEYTDWTPAEKMPPFMRAVKYKLQETMGEEGDALAERMGRQLTHSGNANTLYWGYCVDKSAWISSGGCGGDNLANNGNCNCGGGGGCGGCAEPTGTYNKWHYSLTQKCGGWQYVCMDCSVSNVPGNGWGGGTKNAWHCDDPHPCLSCEDGVHIGNRCPREDSQGCRIPIDNDAGETGYSNCYKALGKLAWSPQVKQVHNEYDSTEIYYANWAQYMTNNRRDCFTHCWLTRCDNSYYGNGGSCNYLSLNKKTGTFNYNLRHPFYYNVDFKCDNGFHEWSWEFYIEVACHPTSTNVTLPGLVEHQRHAIRQDANWYPYHNHPNFQTSEPYCNLFTGTNYKLGKDTLGLTITNNLQNAIFDQAGSSNHVRTQAAFRQKRALYEFYIYRSARGGAYLWTPRLTLEVYCDINSCTVTETYMETNQVYEVGSSHGFYFQEWTQNTDCPIENYRITVWNSRTSDHQSFIQAENTFDTRRDQQGSVLDLMMAEVWDTDIETTYSFRIEAVALGGSSRWSNTKTLTYQCLDNVFIQNGFDFNSQFYSNLKAPGGTARYDWSDFTSWHHLCPIIEYFIDNNNNPAWTGTMANNVAWDTTCKTEFGALCKTVQLDVDQLGTYDFWVVGQTKGGSKKSFQVTVTVGCGDEKVTVNPTEIQRYYPRDTFTDTSPINIKATGTDAAWKSLFTITHPQLSVCNFNKWKIWKYENGTGVVDANITLTNSLSETNANIGLRDHKPMNYKVFYIQLETDGGATNMIKFNYTICGYEEIQPSSNIDYDYMFRRTDIDQQRILTYTFLDTIFREDVAGGVLGCFNDTIDFFTDPWCQLRWTNPSYPFEKVAILPDGGGNQMVYQYTNISYPEVSLWACRRTLGDKYAGVRMNFEVCGSETISLAPDAGYDSLSYLNLTYPQYDCKQYYCLTDRASYRGNFTSSSRMCEPNLFKVYSKDANGNFVPESSSLVQIDINGNLVVKTHVSYNKELFIGSYNVGGTDYLAINVTVVPGEQGDGRDAVNQPPYMRLGIENLNANMSYNNFTSKRLYIQLSEFMDDFFEWESLTIRSDELGNVTFTNGSGVIKSDYFQPLNYDKDSNRIYFEFSSYLEYAKYEGLHTLNVTITDTRGASSSYRPNATFFYEPYREPVPQVLVKTYHPHMGFYAYIQSMDKYGQVEIKFSRTLDPDIDPQKLNSSGMDIYVEPYRQWPDDYRKPFNHSQSRMNFTWNVKAIENDTMFLNVSFYKPHWISTQVPIKKDETGHDKIVIHFKNWAENLNNYNEQRFSTGKRFLVNDGESSDASMFKGIHVRSIDEEYFVSRNSTARFDIRHQFYQGAPETQLNVYSEGKKDFLKSLIIVGGLVQLMGLSSSFYLITAMMTSLQLAIHLPIMNFKFPSNVMTYLKSMVPVVMFDVIENHPFYVTIFDSKEEGFNITNIRPQVEDLTYDKHNPWLNLGTLAFILFLCCLRILFMIFVLYPCSRCSHKNAGRVKQAYHSEKDSLFWGDFLFIFIEGFLEILIASVVFFYVPTESYENTEGLTFCTVVFLIITCLIIPFVFIYVLTRNVRKYQARHFNLRWGALYKRIRFQNKPQMFYYGIFVLRRLMYVLLISEVMFSVPVYQVISLVLMNFGVMIYFTHVLPKSSFFLNWLEIFNESQVTLCTYHLYVFTPWVWDYDTQYFMGWVFIIILSLAFLVNILYILFTLYKELKLLCTKWWRIIKEWCKDKCKKKPKKETPKPEPKPQIQQPIVYVAEVYKPFVPPVEKAPTPPPEEKKDNNLGTYQPQIYAMKGGKVFKMKDEDDNDIEKAIMLNDNQAKDDKWKHQSAPTNAKKFDWNAIPDMINDNDNENKPPMKKLAGDPRMKKLAKANPEVDSNWGAIPDPAKKKNPGKVAPNQDKGPALKKGNTLARIMESDHEHDQTDNLSEIAEVEPNGPAENTQEMKDLNKFFNMLNKKQQIKPESSIDIDSQIGEKNPQKPGKDKKDKKSKKDKKKKREKSNDQESNDTMEELKIDPGRSQKRPKKQRPKDEKDESESESPIYRNKKPKKGKKKDKMLLLDQFAEKGDYENPFRNEGDENEKPSGRVHLAQNVWNKLGGQQ